MINFFFTRIRKLLLLLFIMILSSCHRGDFYHILDTIQTHVQNEEYEKIDQYIYNISFRNNDKVRNSEDLIINGMRKKISAGNFSYSEEGINFHKKRIDRKILDANMYLINTRIRQNPALMSDRYVGIVSYRKKENLKIYINGETEIIFIKDEDDKYKLLYTKNLTKTSYFPNDKVDYTKKEKRMMENLLKDYNKSNQKEIKQ